MFNNRTKFLLIAGLALFVAACAAPTAQEQSSRTVQDAPATEQSATRTPPSSGAQVVIRGDAQTSGGTMGEPDGVIMSTPDSAGTASSQDYDAMQQQAEVMARARAEERARVMQRREEMARAREEAYRREQMAQQEMMEEQMAPPMAAAEAPVPAPAAPSAPVDGGYYDEAANDARAAYQQQMASADDGYDAVEKSTGDQATAPQWVVGKYEQKADFLADVPELANNDTDWGEVLTGLVVAALQNRSQTSEGMDTQATNEELRALAVAGVSYYCDGSLAHFAIDRKPEQGMAEAKLETIYKLRRVFGDRFMTVQREPIDVSVDAPVNADAELMLNLALNNVAVLIANRIVADVPADLAAIIN